VKNTNGNKAVFLIIALLIFGLIFFGCGSQEDRSGGTSKDFDLTKKKAEVHQSINEGIKTIDQAIEDLK